MRFKFLGSSLAIFIYYLIVTLAWTYPLVFQINTNLLGYHDAWQFIWNFWWVKTALINLHTNPFYTYYQYWPNGISLLFHTLNLSNSLLSIPLQYLFSLTTTYNILILLNFSFNGFATYLLVHYLTKNKIASFVAGYILAFSPYMFAHALGHLNLMSFAWVPLAILFIIKMSRGEAKWYLPTLFIVLTGLSDWYYFFYLGIFLIFYLLFVFITNRKIFFQGPFGKYLILTILISLAILSPYLGSMIYFKIKTNDFNIITHNPIDQSVDFLAFFIPNATSRFRDHFMTFWRNWHWTWEGIGYLGYSVLVFSLYSILKVRTKEIFFWLICVLLFGVLALGPYLHVNGKLFHFPLPYYFLDHYLPFMDLQGMPARFAVMVYLSLAVLAGYAITNIIKTRTILKIIFVSVLLIILIVEYLPYKLVISPVPIPDFYVVMQNDPDNYAILDISNEENLALFYQTIHHKKLINGHVSRQSQTSINFLLETPIVADIYHFDKPDKVYDPQMVKNTLIQYNIKYILVAKKDKARISILDRMGLKPREDVVKPLVYQVY